jgi:uncharacterized protein YdaU (DUF1376 family)
MAKDPAVLFYINDWLTSTAEMDADVRGWYLNLLLHNYDKKDLPNDVEKLAVLCNVKFSEYERFKQVFEQVLKQKFELTSENRLTNERTNDILKNREIFKDKRSNAGKVSYVMKYMAKNFNKQYKVKDLKEFTKENFDYNIDLKNEQVLKQVFEQVFELYRNENESIVDISLNIKEREINFKKYVLEFSNKYETELLKAFFNYWSEPNKTNTKMLWELKPTFDISRRLATWNSNNFNKNKNGKSNITDSEQFKELTKSIRSAGDRI